MRATLGPDSYHLLFAEALARLLERQPRRISPEKNRQKAGLGAPAPAAPTTPEIALKKPVSPAPRALKVGPRNAHNEPSAKK